MVKLIKKIFKAGNYGKKGNYPKAKLQKWVDNGKEFSVIPGHIKDWLDSGYPRTAIPIGGKVKCTSVDNEGFLYGEIQYNEFGKKVTEGGAYENFSIGIDTMDNPDHLALLGYAPPHIKELDKAFSEFSEEFQDREIKYIEFEEGGTMGIDEILAALGALSAEDALKVALASVEGLDVTEANITGLDTLQEKLWEKQNETWYVEKLESVGYKVAKEFSEDQIKKFAEGAGLEIKKPALTAVKTEAQIREEAMKEFSMKQEEKELKEKVLKLFPPSLKHLAEFCVESAFSGDNYVNIIEFSEEEKTPMKDHLEKMVEEGGPFSKMFKNISEEMKLSEFSETKTGNSRTDEIINKAKKLAEEVM